MACPAALASGCSSTDEKPDDDQQTQRRALSPVEQGGATGTVANRKMTMFVFANRDAQSGYKMSSYSIQFPLYPEAGQPMLLQQRAPEVELPFSKLLMSPEPRSEESYSERESLPAKPVIKRRLPDIPLEDNDDAPMVKSFPLAPAEPEPTIIAPPVSTQRPEPVVRPRGAVPKAAAVRRLPEPIKTLPEPVAVKVAMRAPAPVVTAVPVVIQPRPVQVAVAKSVSASAAGAKIIRVGPGDTLWRTATRARPDGGVSMSQVMLSLLQLNPTQFEHYNVNAMLPNAVLQVPSREQMLATPVAEAMRQIQGQHNQWQQRQ